MAALAFLFGGLRPIGCFEELMPAPLSEAAIEKAAEEFKVPANRLMAIRR
jgi:hypothetical protein